ncbi:MAG: prepilin-type N-terminal cleavage/methylation domain-containing protein [Candidatus Levybacteria bacterium]|nr:prepilin-type N-terminal cleavage/methylation domain-containing protein [Candidatus Levybacteria bacterium]
MKNQRGQSLIEAVVALVTILLIVTAIAIVIVNGLYNSQFIKGQNEANKYAQEGMEFVRNIQKNDLGAFGSFNQNATYCIDEVNSTLTTNNCNATTVNTGTSHIRTVTFSPGASQCIASEIKVTVVVAWSSTKCPTNNTFCHKSELISCMPYNYPASNP